MPIENSDIVLMPSILDRLIDLEPRETRETARSRTISVAEIKRSVLRDLEWLLNTRQPIYADERMEEARGTVAFYGVPDFTGLGARSEVEFKQFTSDIESAIRAFEPRIFDVQITFEPFDNTDRQIRFKVDARLDIDPVPEPISFDSVIQPGTGRIILT
jgi:type VI secretion system protein ImpF